MLQLIYICCMMNMNKCIKNFLPKLDKVHCEHEFGDGDFNIDEIRLLQCATFVDGTAMVV